MKKYVISFLLIFCFALLSFGGAVIDTYAENLDESSFSAKSLYLMDYNSGQVLYEKDAEKELPVASIVKLMTIELVCEKLESGELKLDDTVIVSQKAQSMGGSQVFIEEGGEYSVGDLLKSTIVSSANDASVALAETISGSEENFVVLMNKKAKELGLKNTNYVNCTGLPASNQYSCAKDTAILLKNVLSHDDYHRYSTIWMDSLSHPKGRQSELVNTNKLIRYYEGCDGGKTGSTSEAGYCLVATAKRGDMRLIGSVLGAENGKKRFSETSSLLNYGFSNFENKQVVSKDSLLNDNLQVKNAKVDEVKIASKENIFVLIKKGSDDDITTKVELNSDLKAPLKKGDKVGRIFVMRNSEVVAECDIVSMDDVEVSSIMDNITKIAENWKLKSDNA